MGRILGKFKRKTEPAAEAKARAEAEPSAKAEAKVKAKAKKGKEEARAEPKKGDAQFAYRALLRPMVTEKAASESAQGKYVFEVAPAATKPQIAKAVIGLYGVEPRKVNVLNVRGKAVRHGRTQGKRRNWKKAVVTLKKGDSIEIYEGV